RPGYPEPLIDDVVRLSGLLAGGRILEIGSGTGKATEPFARRGYRLTCIEPGARLAAIARAKLAGSGRVEIVERAFEDWEPGVQRFDLVLAAQAFHFLEPRSALAKIGGALAPAGAFAIVAHDSGRIEGEAHDRIQEAYARHAPNLTFRRDPTPYEDAID